MVSEFCAKDYEFSGKFTKFHVNMLMTQLYRVLKSSKGRCLTRGRLLSTSGGLSRPKICSFLPQKDAKNLGEKSAENLLKMPKVRLSPHLMSESGSVIALLTLEI